MTYPKYPVAKLGISESESESPSLMYFSEGPLLQAPSSLAYHSENRTRPIGGYGTENDNELPNMISAANTVVDRERLLGQENVSEAMTNIQKFIDFHGVRDTPEKRPEIANLRVISLMKHLQTQFHIHDIGELPNNYSMIFQFNGPLPTQQEPIFTVQYKEAQAYLAHLFSTLALANHSKGDYRDMQKFYELYSLVWKNITPNTLIGWACHLRDEYLNFDGTNQINDPQERVDEFLDHITKYYSRIWIKSTLDAIDEKILTNEFN